MADLGLIKLATKVAQSAQVMAVIMDKKGHLMSTAQGGSTPEDLVRMYLGMTHLSVEVKKRLVASMGKCWFDECLKVIKLNTATETTASRWEPQYADKEEINE